MQCFTITHRRSPGRSGVRRLGFAPVFVASSLLAWTASGCDAGTDPDTRLPASTTGTGTTTLAMHGSDLMHLPFWASAVQITGFATCSGSIIGPRHVMMSGHCSPRRNVTNFDQPSPPNIIGWATSYGPGGVVVQSNPIVAFVNLMAIDVGIGITQDDWQVEPLRLLEEPMRATPEDTSWIGRRVLVVGHQNDTINYALGGWAEITGFDSIEPALFYFNFLDDVGVDGGDSGSPILANLAGKWYIVGINKCDGGGTGVRMDLAAPLIRPIVPLRGSHSFNARSSPNSQSDVDGDGKEDFVVTDAAGTHILKRDAEGDGFVTLWDDPAATMGRVENLLGNFDADSKAELLRMDDTKTEVLDFQYDSGLGRWVSSVWWTGPTYIGQANLHVADFDGNGRSDILVVSHCCVYLLRSTGTGFDTMPELYYRTHNMTNTTAVVDDFTGDGRADVILQRAGGADLWKGISSSPWLQSVGVNTTLARGSAYIQPAYLDSYNSLGVDLIVSRADGTRFYYSRSDFTFVQDAALYQSGWLAGEVAFTPGRYDAVTGDDLMILTRGGAWLWLGQDTTGFGYQWVPNVWSSAGQTVINARILNRDWTSYNGSSEDVWLTATAGSWGASWLDGFPWWGFHFPAWPFQRVMAE
jgi:hypothetical protein